METKPAEQTSNSENEMKETPTADELPSVNADADGDKLNGNISSTFGTRSQYEAFAWSLVSECVDREKYTRSIYQNISYSDDVYEDVWEWLTDFLVNEDVKLLFCRENYESPYLLCYISDKEKKFFTNIEASDSAVNISLFSKSESIKEARSFSQTIKEEINKIDEGGEDEVELLFSYVTQCGDVAVKQSKIYCPTWEEVQVNYPQTDNLDILHDEINSELGRMIIWYGPPGTGKTYAIRSLIRAHKNDIVPIYITDTNMFTSNIAYYYDLISSNDSRILFIFEDAADYLLPETRSSASEQMSNILNLTDGLLGAGRKDMFLITFNEEIGRIDDAVKREGRCHSITKFPKFTEEEAREWLRNKDIDQEVIDREVSGQKVTLAQLYEITKKQKRQEFASKDDKTLENSRSFEEIEQDVGL